MTNCRYINLCAKLAEFRSRGDFCDVEICIRDKSFFAHKLVLAACSPYFQAMFLGSMAEKYQSSISLHEVCPKIFDDLLKFAYGLDMNINPENVEDVLVVADMLQFTEAVNVCADYLKDQLDATNCIGIYCFACQHALKSLQKSSWKFLLSNFVQISLKDEFISLPFDDLLSLVKCENIAIESEVNVLDAVMKWLSHDLHSRRRYCVKLFKHIRICLIPFQDMKKVVNHISDVCLKVAVKILTQDSYPEESFGSSMNKTCNSFWKPRQSARKGFYAIGGCIPNNSHRYQWENNVMNSVSYIERFDSFSEQWDAYPVSLREARTSLAAVAVNARIYAIGGEKDSMIFGSMECFDTLSKQWIWDLPSLVVPRSSCQAICLAENIYILGGYVGSGVGKSIECFNTESNTCVLTNFSMQTERHSFGAVCLDGIIYMAGGIGLSECELRTVECYDLDKHEWWFARDMHFKRAYFSLVVHKELIYAIGGHNEIQGTLNNVEVYDPSINSWKLCAAMKQPRASAFVSVMNNKIVVVGGKFKAKTYERESSWNVLNDAEIFDPDTNSWSSYHSMNFDARCDGVALVI